MAVAMNAPGGIMAEEAGSWVLGVTLLIAGATLIVLGRKQRAGTLRRNWLAGLRTSETMLSDAAWHAAHTASAGMVAGAGVVQLVTAAALLVLRPTDGATLAFIALGGTALTLALVITAGVRGHRIAARTNRGDSDRCHPPRRAG